MIGQPAGWIQHEDGTWSVVDELGFTHSLAVEAALDVPVIDVTPTAVTDMEVP
ncbi:hypothetical protein IU433_17175 [Nocardia puris]|uniref:hypothetical protein n=1 Tax=Nocardia puris TaxID=208602 RepID=UPI001894AAA0|nr:hypothetical protein [Nocardia puris]MBF6460765.1 hypothetical protein [Nocardia puris]